MNPPAAITPVDLSTRERQALVEAASWYAKYHARIIAERADDRSAAEVARREHFEELYSALAKLGIRLRRPDGLRAAS